MEDSDRLAESLREFHAQTSPDTFAFLFQQAAIRAEADEQDIVEAIQAELNLRSPPQ